MAEATREQDIEAIVRGEHSDPFSILGQHRASLVRGRASVVRAFVPWTEGLSVVDLESGEARPMERLHPDGFYEAVFVGRDPFRYRLRSRDADGTEHEFWDPY